jgi:hypothetical protein
MLQPISISIAEVFSLNLADYRADLSLDFLVQLKPLNKRRA